MPTSDQIASRLFKKSFGKGDTDQGKPFFEEDPAIDGYIGILPDQIWAEGDLIPESSPFGTPNATTMSIYDGSISGVVKYVHNLVLKNNAPMGVKSYYHEDLRDAIPFNFGGDDVSTYNYFVTDYTGSQQIFFGQDDWLLDVDQGAITFYEAPPVGVAPATPPRISFYKYVGLKGLSSALDPSGTSWNSFQLNNDASGVAIKDASGILQVVGPDISTLATLQTGSLIIDNLTGPLYAQDGSVYVGTPTFLLAYDTSIVGNDASTVFEIVHNLNTKKQNVMVWDDSDNEVVYPGIERGLNIDRIAFHTPPASGNVYYVTILGF
jgi:hypothetical protein